MSAELKDGDSGTFTIPANDQENFAFSGRFVRCLSSDGELEISFNNGSRMFFEGGLQRAVDDASADYDTFQIYNDTAQDITVKIAWGYGRVDDSRLSLSGSVSIKNELGDVLNTYDEAIALRLNNIIEKMGESGFQQSTNLAPKTTLNSASYAEQLGSGTTEVVSAAANTNGILLRIASVSALGNAQFSIKVGGNLLLVAGTRSTEDGTSGVVFEKDILIPSGVNLELEGTANADKGRFAYVWFEVL